MIKVANVVSMNAAQKALARTLPTDLGYVSPCLVFTGARTKNGYASIRSDAGPSANAHRLVFETLVGPIPDGLTIDHECHDPSTCTGGFDCPHRACLNVDHMSLLPAVENTRRGNSPAAINRRKSECIRGHVLSGENLYVNPTTGKRRCRTCDRGRNVA